MCNRRVAVQLPCAVLGQLCAAIVAFVPTAEGGTVSYGARLYPTSASLILQVSLSLVLGSTGAGRQLASCRPIQGIPYFKIPSVVCRCLVASLYTQLVPYVYEDAWQQ